MDMTKKWVQDLWRGKSGGLIKLDIEKGKLKFTDAKTKVKA